VQPRAIRIRTPRDQKNIQPLFLLFPSEPSSMSESETEPKTDYGLGESSGGVFSSENASWAGRLATDKMTELKQMASEGDFSIRLLAQIGGLAMMVLSIMGLVLKIINLDFLGALVEVYTFLMGLIVIILESKAFPRRFEQTLNKYMLFLRFVWGRGCLYFVAGTLQATQVSSQPRNSALI
jgi:hypothetical protein